MAIGLAWAWLRFQPRTALSLWCFPAFYAPEQARARKIEIVPPARRLLVELWRYLKRGVLPEVAELKV